MLSVRVLVGLILISGYYNVNSKSVYEHRNVGIVGGHSVSIHNVPYIVSLRLNGTHHWCGGSIIHEQFVLTAAHYIVPNRKYKVLVGTDKVHEGGKLYDVEKILIHQKYSNKTNDYDICILKLNETLTFGPKVDKINLIKNKIRLTRRTMLNATGWGYTKPEGKISPILQQVKIPMVDRLSCQHSYGTRRNITRRMLCAGGHGNDSCTGDSGGPLTRHNKLVGVTSFGAGCGVKPGVYTKISVFHKWIKEVIDVI